MSAEKARKTLLTIDIPRDELALRMMIVAVGARPPAHASTAEALAEAERANPGIVATFRAQADAAVAYFHERINAARQPS